MKLPLSSIAFGVVALAVGVAGTTLAASGPVGVYAIIEKVVFEPNDQTPERVQVWGAFAYADPELGATTMARRGFLYFRLPVEDATAAKLIRTEWRDLKTVAGTGQAVAFGEWGYIGDFGAIDPANDNMALSANRRVNNAYILEVTPGDANIRVRPASEAPRNPALYRTNAGVVKLSAEGSRAETIRKLRDALRAP